MISIIAAMTRRRVIGNGGKLPWNIPEEMGLFAKITSGNTVIMGRKTFDSIGILKGRRNIIITRGMERIEGADVCRSVDKALEKARSYGGETFIIGGGEIFAETIGLADRMYLSYIRRDYPGDTLFPKFGRDEWVVKERKEYKEFEQVIYARN